MDSRTVSERGVLALLTAVAWAAVAVAESGPNLLSNPSFEEGQREWHFSTAKGTQVRLAIDGSDAADGDYSAKVTLEKVAGWGTQFGQSIAAGKVGKTYTLAVLAKAVNAPVTVRLEIERSGKPYDRAVRSEVLTLTKGEWTELHATFKVGKSYPQGWFAYVSCSQPNAAFRVDMFRLYEGGYLPYEQIARDRAAVVGVHLFDTGTPSSAPIAGAALARREGWVQVPENKIHHAFRGDAVVVHTGLAVVLRRRGCAAEVYAAGEPRAALSPAADQPLTFSSIKIVKNDSFEAEVAAHFSAADGTALGLRLGLKMGQTFVRTRPLASTRKLRIAAPCPTVVMPDFFADDIVMHAAGVPVAKAELPAEHFLMHMLGKGEAIVMAVGDKLGEDVAMTLGGKGEGRSFTCSDMDYGKDGTIWVAALAAPGIWHVREIAPEQRGKVTPLEWRPPFPAQWRVDWQLDSGVTDSWEMAAEQPNGSFVRRGWVGQGTRLKADRKRWTSVLGRFLYPCWVDKAGRAFLQPLKKVLAFQGPAVIYPINRTRATPLDRFSVVDIVRQTLGVGPCEYVLDLEAQKTSSKGRATCGTRDTLNPIYAKGRQKQERAKIEKALDDVVVFVKFIRGRIEDYVAWGHEMQRYLEQQKQAHPELAGFLGEMQTLAAAIDQHYAARKDKIKTPAYVVGLTEKFRNTLLDYEGADAAQRCKEITAAIVVVGGSQDHLVGDCRVAAKRLRQRAALAMAVDPRVAGIAKEIRARSYQIMRNPVSYEAPRY